MSENAAEMSKRAVKEWFSNEGIKVESISNPRANYLFKIKFQRFVFTVIRPNDQNYIQIETQVLISPQHLKLLTAEKMRQFQMDALKFAFTTGINLGFMQPKPGQQRGPKPPGPGFVVSDRIYDDGFSEHELWLVMRRLHSTVDMVITILNDVTGTILGKPDEQPDSAPDYYT